MDNKKRKGLMYLINNSNKNFSIESKYNLRKRKNPESNKENSKEIFLKIKKKNIKPNNNNNQNRVICKKYSYKSQLTLNSLSTISTFRANNTNESIENKNENIIEYIRKKYKKHDVNNYINNKKKSKSIQKKNEIKIEENNEYKENINLFNSCNLKIKNYNKKDIINIQKNYDQKNKEIITKKIKNENENYLNLKFNTIETDYFLLNNEKNFFNNSNESLVKKMKKNKKKTGFNICNTDNKNKISNYSYNLFKKKINIYNKKSFGEKNLFFYKNNLTLNFNENNKNDENFKSNENSFYNNILIKQKNKLCFITKEIKINKNNNSKIKIKLNLNFFTKFIKKNLCKSNLNFVSYQNKNILKKEKLNLSFISKKIYCLPILHPQINKICYITKNNKNNKKINKKINLKFCFITKIIINEKIKNENNNLNNFTQNLFDDKNNYSNNDLQLSTSDNSNNNNNKINYNSTKKEILLKNNNIFQNIKQNILEFINKIIEKHIKLNIEKKQIELNKNDSSSNSKENNSSIIKIESNKIHLKSHSTINSKSKKIFLSNSSLSFNLLTPKINNIKFNTEIKPEKNRNKFSLTLKSKDFDDNDLKDNNIYIKIIIKEDIINWLKSIKKINLNMENISKELNNNLNWDKIDEIIIKNKINLFKIVKSFLEISIELIIEKNNFINNNIDKLKFYIQNFLDYYSSDLSLNNKKILQKKFVNYFFNLTLKLKENNNNIYELLGNTLFILIKNNLFILKDLDFFINNKQNSKINMIKILGFMININCKSNKHCFNEIKKTNFYQNDKNLFNEILLIYE